MPQDDKVLAILIPSSLWQQFSEQAHMCHSDTELESKAEEILVGKFDKYVIGEQLFEGPFFADNGIVRKDLGNGYSVPADGEKMGKDIKPYDRGNSLARARRRNKQYNLDCIEVEKKGLII